MIEHVFATEATVDDAAARRLNDEQRAAASHDGGPLLILAGAGTGKTATLAARVAVLLDRGLEPERILLLTFTRRAAREMLARVDALRGSGRAASRVVGGTFHAIGWQLVRAHAAALRLPGTPTVLDAGDAADLIDLVREERGLAGTGGGCRASARCSTSTAAPSTRSGRLRGRRRVVPVVHGPPRRPARPVPRLHGAQARARRARPRRPPALLARARAPRALGAAARGALRPRARRRVPGRERAPGSRSSPLLASTAS